MTKDYWKRLTAVNYTAWDLNCRSVVPHAPARNRTETVIKRKARRKDKISLKKYLTE